MELFVMEGILISFESIGPAYIICTSICPYKLQKGMYFLYFIIAMIIFVGCSHFHQLYYLKYLNCNKDSIFFRKKIVVNVPPLRELTAKQLRQCSSTD